MLSPFLYILYHPLYTFYVTLPIMLCHPPLYAVTLPVHAVPSIYMLCHPPNNAVSPFLYHPSYMLCHPPYTCHVTLLVHAVPYLYMLCQSSLYMPCPPSCTCCTLPIHAVSPSLHTVSPSLHAMSPSLHAVTLPTCCVTLPTCYFNISTCCVTFPTCCTTLHIMPCHLSCRYLHAVAMSVRKCYVHV